MIDDNWQKDYGNFNFRPDKFPNPKAMVDELHAMGFKVMLWVSPFVSPDSEEFRYLKTKGIWIKEKVVTSRQFSIGGTVPVPAMT